MTKYTEMTGPQLVDAYNDRVKQLGSDKFQPVKKFRNKQEAAKRLQAIDRAMKKASGVATNGNATGEPRVTVRSLTDEYNALVPQAAALGIRARHHTSLFGSMTGAQTQLEKLRAAIEDKSQGAT